MNSVAGWVELKWRTQRRKVHVVAFRCLFSFCAKHSQMCWWTNMWTIRENTVEGTTSILMPPLQSRSPPEWILFLCNGGYIVSLMVCRADIKPDLLCPQGASGVSVHQIFFPPLICFFLHLSMRPALICAADEGKRLSQKEKMELSMYWRLGTKDVPQSQAPVEKNKKAMLLLRLMAIHSVISSCEVPEAFIRSRFSCFHFLSLCIAANEEVWLKKGPKMCLYRYC